MQFTRKRMIFALALCLSAVKMHAANAAESAADFYKGKTINAVSQFAEDAVLSVLSRIAAPYLEKYTGANVVVKPMPGGGGMLALNSLYKAKPNGLTLILMAHGPKMITSGLFNLQGVRYEWKKFVPLGKIVAQNSCVIVGKKSSWQKPADLVGKKFNYGESSPFYGPLFAETFGWDKMTVIPGYRSTTGRAVAISRGEIQAASTSLQTIAANPDLVKPLVCALPEASLSDVPSVQQDVPPGHEKWAKEIEGWSNAMFVSIAPPGIAPDRAAFLESALKEVWADPGFRNSLNKVKMDVTSKFVNAEELKGFMNSLAQFSPTEVKAMKHVITEKYKKK
jgi:putative tricarboxylic transport membrane protein